MGGVSGSVITLDTIEAGGWTFASFGLPVHIGLASGAIAALILRPRPRPRPRPRRAAVRGG